MSTRVQSRKRKRPTFIERARREQIVEATIDTVAELGFINASFAEIAKVADISKAVIPYYFGSKDELVEQTLNTLYERSDDFVRTRVEAQHSAWDKVRAHVTAQLEYAKEHRREAVADWELQASFDSAEAKRSFSETTYDPLRELLGETLKQGQETREFGPVPVNTVASLILAVLDGIILQWTWDAEAVNLDECCREILKMLEPYLFNQEDQVGRP
jgi:AcrR family transcriptional regulator